MSQSRSFDNGPNNHHLDSVHNQETHIFFRLRITHHKLEPNHYPNMDNHTALNFRKDLLSYLVLHGLICACNIQFTLSGLA